MGFERRLAGGFAAPALLLLAVLALLAWLVRLPGLYADKLVLALVAGSLVWLLWARTRRTSLLVARFVAALEHGDLAQAFRSSGRGAGLDELGAAFDGALRRLRAERLASATELRFAAALADGAPTPLLGVDASGTVHLANKAARQLFREADGRAASAFACYGPDFADALATAQPGARRVCRVRWNGLFQRAVLAVSLVDRGGRPWRIVSVQIIQGELDAAELATQTDLVRVLTHEIMNSLTPVTSLADSAARLLALSPADDPHAFDDARAAVDALARRASGIAHFVESYRAFSETPAVRIARFAVGPWAAELARSFRATPAGAEVELSVLVDGTVDGAMAVDGDADLLGQVALNLLKNAGQATAGRADRRVRFAVGRNEAGRTEIVVADNGPGIPAELEHEIFLPFFTTKPDGTGVGLSLARQVALLHGGAVGVVPSPLGGAAIQIVF